MAVAMNSVRARVAEIDASGIPQTLQGLIRKLRPILSVMSMEAHGDAFDTEQEGRPGITLYDYWKEIYLRYVENPSISVVLQSKAISIQVSIKNARIDSLVKEVKPLLSRFQRRILRSILTAADYDYNAMDTHLEILEDTKTLLNDMQVLIDKIKPSFTPEEWSTLKAELDNKNLNEAIDHLVEIKTEKNL